MNTVDSIQKWQIKIGQKYWREFFVGGSERSLKDIAINCPEIRVFHQIIKFLNSSGNGWDIACSSFAHDWRYFCKSTVKVFGVDKFVINIPRRESWPFRLALFLLQFLFFRSPQNFLGDCAFEYWKKLPEFKIGCTGKVFFVENTRQLSFIFVFIVFPYIYPSQQNMLEPFRRRSIFS